jgi:hypothetical protein
MREPSTQQCEDKDKNESINNAMRASRIAMQRQKRQHDESISNQDTTTEDTTQQRNKSNKDQNKSINNVMSNNVK